MNIEVTDITILLDDGTDKLFLNTTLPLGVFPYDENVKLTLDVAKGKGEQYVKKYFPEVPYKIKDIR